MSRGHGSIQRRVLAWVATVERTHSVYLPGEYRNENGLAVWHADVDRVVDYPAWVELGALTRVLFGLGPDDPDALTRGQVESVRRGCKGLAREGLVELDYRRTRVTVRHPGSWWAQESTGDRVLLYVRPVLTADEQAAAEAEQERQEELSRQRYARAMQRLREIRGLR